MQHTCARRPLAFAVASLTTLASFAAFNNTNVARACSPPPTFSETLSMSDLIVVGSITEIAKGKVTYGDESFEVPIATVHIAETIKGTVERGQSVRIQGVDSSDFELRTNEDEAPVSEASDRPELPLSMRTGLFLAQSDQADVPAASAAWSDVRVFDITDVATRDALIPLVRAYTTLDAVSDPVQRQTAFLEWVVDCAEEPATRRDGFYDFSQADDARNWRMHSEDAADRDHPAAKVTFTDGQVDRLVAAWLDALAKRDDGAMWFGNALGHYRGELVASRLLEVIAAEGEGGTNDIGTWMMTVASIYEWRSGHLLTQKLWESEDPAERAKIVRQFLELAPLRADVPELLAAADTDVETTESVEDVESEAVTEMEAAEREAIEAVERAGDEEVVDIGAEVEIEPMNLVDLRRPDGID